MTIWLCKRRVTGDIFPVKRSRYKTRKLEDAALIAYIKENNDSTLVEIGEHFNVSVTAASKREKILGITRKKNHVLRRAGRTKKTTIFEPD